MKQFKILTFIPANGYPVALDAIEALKKLDQFVVTIDLRKVRREVLSQTIEAVIKRFEPSFIFTTNAVGLIPDLFDDLKIPYVSWWTIDPANLKPPPSTFYHIFIIDKTRLPELKEEGYKSIHYLPFSANPRIFKPLPLEKRYECNISFAGACRFSMGYLENKDYIDRLFGGEGLVSSLIDDQIQNPTRLIEETYKRITGQRVSNGLIVELRRIEYEAMRLYRNDIVSEAASLGIHLYGDDGWKNFSHPKAKYRGWLDNRSELPKLYNASKINLSVQISTLKGSLSKRTFDIPACGGFVLGDFREALLWHFEDGKEVVYFREKGELKGLIKYYLHHPDEREAIAQQARRRILKDHTYLHRIRRILEVMKETL